MSSFDESQWASSTFSKEYLASADHYIPDRFHLFNVLRSFYRTFVARADGVRVCDLGCGDGVLTEQLLREGAPLESLLVDGSLEMLEAARRRLSNRAELSFLQRGFNELIADSSVLGEFQLVMSSFALHHLERPERRRLFEVIFRHLRPGGYFLNIETALSDFAPAVEWHYELWREWIARRSQLLGLGDRFDGVPEKARSNPDNHYSPLSEQLCDLNETGFREVECHYRNGIFAIYTGKRP